MTRRSIKYAKHNTSVSLEEAFWLSAKEIAEARHIPLSDLIAEIDANRERNNLSSAIRIFVLQYYRDRVRVLPITAVDQRSP